ncbi:MAG: hypothetical protein HWE20_10235 [Gammaproteobacteria bacterium]|nr:hypothetical protein [Gammaproteobacteria bacterium]
MKYRIPIQSTAALVLIINGCGGGGSDGTKSLPITTSNAATQSIFADIPDDPEYSFTQERKYSVANPFDLTAYFISGYINGTFELSPRVGRFSLGTDSLSLAIKEYNYVVSDQNNDWTRLRDCESSGQVRQRTVIEETSDDGTQSAALSRNYLSCQAEGATETGLQTNKLRFNEAQQSASMSVRLDGYKRTSNSVERYEGTVITNFDGDGFKFSQTDWRSAGTLYYGTHLDTSWDSSGAIASTLGAVCISNQGCMEVSAILTSAVADPIDSLASADIELSNGSTTVSITATDGDAIKITTKVNGAIIDNQSGTIDLSMFR